RGEPPAGRPWDIARPLAPPSRSAPPPEPQPATGFFTDTTVCIGCKACEVACKEWNLLPADGLHWTGNSYDNTGELSATSWRHVKFIEQIGEPTSAVPLAEATSAFSLERLLQEPNDGRSLIILDVSN